MRMRRLCLTAVVLLVIAVSIAFYFNYFDTASEILEGTLVKNDNSVKKASRKAKKACRKMEKKMEKGIDIAADYAEDII